LNKEKKEVSLEVVKKPIYLVGKDAYELEDLLVFGTQPAKEPGVVY